MGDEMGCANILHPTETILCGRLEGRRTHKRIKRVCALQYCTVIIVPQQIHPAGFAVSS